MRAPASGWRGRKGYHHGRQAREDAPPLFLNPYEDMAFTKCPRCDGRTKQRKLPLVIYIEPQQIPTGHQSCLSRSRPTQAIEIFDSRARAERYAGTLQ